MSKTIKFNVPICVPRRKIMNASNTLNDLDIKDLNSVVIESSDSTLAKTMIITIPDELIKTEEENILDIFTLGVLVGQCLKG